jgi:hypothetical protein
MPSCLSCAALCVVLQVRRPCEFGPDGWPAHPDPIDVAAGQVGGVLDQVDGLAID